MMNDVIGTKGPFMTTQLNSLDVELSWVELRRQNVYGRRRNSTQLDVELSWVVSL